MKTKQTLQKSYTNHDLKKAWEKVWNNMNEVNKLQATIFPVILLVHQRIKSEPFFKEFEKLKDSCEEFYDVIEHVTGDATKPQPVAITWPWESDKFKKAWQYWKDYLLEQHNIVISSRTEQKQLDNLYKIADEKEENAYTMIDYSISSFYRTLFRLDVNEKKTDNKPLNQKSEDDY